MKEKFYLFTTMDVVMTSVLTTVSFLENNDTEYTLKLEYDVNDTSKYTLAYFKTQEYIDEFGCEETVEDYERFELDEDDFAEFNKLYNIASKLAHKKANLFYRLYELDEEVIDRITSRFYLKELEAILEIKDFVRRLRLFKSCNESFDEAIDEILNK